MAGYLSDTCLLPSLNSRQKLHNIGGSVITDFNKLGGKNQGFKMHDNLLTTVGGVDPQAYNVRQPSSAVKVGS